MPHAIHYLMRSQPGSTSILLSTKIIAMSLFDHDSPSTAREMCVSIFINSGFSLSCIKNFGSVFHNYFHVLAIGGFWILCLPASSNRQEADTRPTYNHTFSDPVLWSSSYPQSVTFTPLGIVNNSISEMLDRARGWTSVEELEIPKLILVPCEQVLQFHRKYRGYGSGFLWLDCGCEWPVSDLARTFDLTSEPNKQRRVLPCLPAVPQAHLIVCTAVDTIISPGS